MEFKREQRLITRNAVMVDKIKIFSSAMQHKSQNASYCI